MDLVYNMDMSHVQSVERAFTILKTVGENPEGIGAAEIAKAQNEFEEGLIAYAAPIINRENSVVAAVTIGGPAYRFTKEKEQFFATSVREIAQEISKKL